MSDYAFAVKLSNNVQRFFQLSRDTNDYVMLEKKHQIEIAIDYHRPNAAKIY